MAEGKRYYWLKLHDDFFDSKRIKKLRRMAGGDTYTIIYLKMQLMAMKKDGVLTFTHLENDFPDELALDLNESPDDVRVTLAYLLSCGLAETSDDVHFFLPYAVENTASEGAAAQRMRESRARRSVTGVNNVTPMLQNCYGELDKELEIEKEKETNANAGNAVDEELLKTLLNECHAETLSTEYPHDLLLFALNLCSMQGERAQNERYLRAILNNWERMGITTAEQAKEHEWRRRA